MASSVLDAFREKVGSGNESIDALNGKFTVTRIFQGPYEDRIKFVKTFLNQLAKGTTFGGTIRFPFQEHPKHKGLFATSAEIKGRLGADKIVATNTFKYITAIITIKYQALPFKQPQNQSHDNEDKPLLDFVEETSDASVEMIQIPGEDVKVDGVEQHDKGPFNKIAVYYHINIRQPFVSKPHWDQIMDNLGKVNQNLFFTPAVKVAEVNTVRYDGPSDRIKIDALGPRNLQWDITHKFVYNRIGWNKIWKDGAFVAPDDLLFDQGDLMGIFFGDKGGPIKDNLDAIQIANNELILARGALQTEINGANDPHTVSQLETDVRVAFNKRNNLITQMGGTLLDQQNALDD